MILRRLPRWAGLVLLFVASFVVFVLAWWLAVIPLVIAEEGIPASGWSEFVEYLHWLATPSEWEEAGGWLFLFAAMHAAAQVAFVAPLVGAPRLSGEGIPLRISVFGASMIGGLIAVGMLLVPSQLLLIAFSDSATIDGLGQLGELLLLPSVFLAWIISGAVWMIVLRKVGRSRDPNGIAGLLRMLLVGTSIELALSIPVYLLARRRESCYCGLPTFYSIIAGTAALVWMCGPWAVLWLTRGYRRGWRRHQCVRCGYPRHTESIRCSECGFEFARDGDAPLEQPTPQPSDQTPEQHTN